MLNWLTKKLRQIRSDKAEEPYPSVVLLLENPSPLPKEKVLEIAQNRGEPIIISS
jgi:hypothetical protein